MPETSDGLPVCFANAAMSSGQAAGAWLSQNPTAAIMSIKEIILPTAQIEKLAHGPTD